MKTGTKRDIATSFTTLLFLVIGISGIMMYFHINNGLVKNLHEILGLIFISAVLFHVIFNWASMKKYFSKKIFITATIIVTVVSSLFIYESSNNKENPKMLLIQKVLNAPLQVSLKLLDGNYENAIQKLKKENIIIPENTTISKIADKNKVSPFKIVSIITEN